MFLKFGAAERNRTVIGWVEAICSTIELPPQVCRLGIVRRQGKDGDPRPFTHLPAVKLPCKSGINPTLAGIGGILPLLGISVNLFSVSTLIDFINANS